MDASLNPWTAKCYRNYYGWITQWFRNLIGYSLAGLNPVRSAILNLEDCQRCVTSWDGSDLKPNFACYATECWLWQPNKFNTHLLFWIRLIGLFFIEKTMFIDKSYFPWFYSDKFYPLGNSERCAIVSIYQSLHI